MTHEFDQRLLHAAHIELQGDVGNASLQGVSRFVQGMREKIPTLLSHADLPLGRKGLNLQRLLEHEKVV